MATYRERRLARAERLREWGEQRQRDARPMYDSAREEMMRIPLGEPIHSAQDRRRRERTIARVDRAFEHGEKGDEMVTRADAIEAQAAGAIYDDDPDAIERLEEKLARLEAERERMKQARAQARKDLREELKGLSAYDREQRMPFASYEIQNRGGLITTTRQRIARLKREREHGPTDRYITARFDSECASCGAALRRGDPIRYNRQDGARCYPSCPSEEMK